MSTNYLSIVESIIGDAEQFPLKLDSPLGEVEFLMLNTADFFTYQFGPNAGKTYYRPVTVVSVRFASDPENIFNGEALCSPGDEYDRVKGVRIAAGRALKGLTALSQSERRKLVDLFVEFVNITYVHMRFFGLDPQSVPASSWYMIDPEAREMAQALLAADRALLVEDGEVKEISL